MAANNAPRRPTQAEKRDALLDSAITLFRTRGIAETTVEEITQATGVAKGTFYLYFQTKDDLVDALRVEFAQQLEQLFASAQPPDDAAAWSNFLGALVDSAVELIGEEKELHDLVAALGHAHREGALQAAIARTHKSLAAVVDAGVQAGALDVLDTSTAAWLLFDLVLGAGDRAATDPVNAGRYRRSASNAVQRWLLRR